MKYFILILVLLLSGCGWRDMIKGDKEVTIVQVPVVQPWPAPPNISRPVLAIDQFTDDDVNNPKFDLAMKLYAASLKACMGYSAELEKLLDVYRLQPKLDVKPTVNK